MSESSSPIVAPRAFPERPNLDHLRGQAKTLLDALSRADADAIRRVVQALPHRAAPWQLADAQFTIAREYGFESWPKLAAHVEAIMAKNDREHIKRSLVAALRANDVDAVHKLFASEPEARELVNAPIGDFGGRPISIQKSNAAMLDLLIANGADINLKSEWWAGPWGVLETASPEEADLLIARGATIDIFAAAHLDRLDVAAVLLDADASLVHAKGGDGCRALHFAESPAMIDLLISRGAEIEARDVDHESTALQWALPRADVSPNGGIRPGKLERVRHLVARGAAVDIFAAAALDDVALVQRALAAHESAITARVNAQGYPPCPVAPGGHIYVYTLGGDLTPHAVAAAFGSAKALAALMEHSSPRQRFIAACTTGQRDLARSLLAKDSTLIESITPDEAHALPTAAWNSNADAVLLMLDLGFNPFAKGPDGGTALHCAAWRGLADLVDLILAHPRVKPIRDELITTKDTSHGSTPLGWCFHGSAHCRNPKGDYPRVAKALVAAGAVVGPNWDDATTEVKAALLAK